MLNISAITIASFHLVLKEREYNDLCDRLPRHAILELKNPVKYSTEISGDENRETLISLWYTTISTLVDLMDNNALSGKPWSLEELKQKSNLARRAHLTLCRRQSIDACLLRLAAIEEFYKSYDANRLQSDRAQRLLARNEDDFANSTLVHLKPFGEVLLDMYVLLQPESPRARQIELADALLLPRLDPLEAERLVLSYFREDSLYFAAQSAWKALLETLEQIGLELYRHEQKYKRLNTLLRKAEVVAPGNHQNPYREQVMRQMCSESDKHRNAMRLPRWFFEQRVKPRALLRHAGVPTGLLESREWKNEESLFQAALENKRIERDKKASAELEAKEKAKQEVEQLARIRRAMAEMSKSIGQQ